VKTKTAICVAGMHRSGTSLVAKLLQSCGLHLGPEEEFDFDSNNGEKHWENIRFVALNEKILHRLGGSWDNPPELASGWQERPEVLSLASPAEKLIAMFEQPGRLWGWKDPRNCLTIPFWRRLIPELRVVICVRNPLEVSRSMAARRDWIAIGPFQLWLTYYRELLASIPPERRLVTHYESYFQDAPAELCRVAKGINLEASSSAFRAAAEAVTNNLRHHKIDRGDRAAVPAEVNELYRYLCSEALLHPRQE